MRTNYFISHYVARMASATELKTAVFDTAISAHALWKVRLKTALSGNLEGLTPAGVRADTQCELGKILNSADAKKLGSAGDVQEIQTLHKQFHAEAATVLELITAGKKKEADAAMGMNGAFTRVSAALVTKLMKLKSLAG